MLIWDALGFTDIEIHSEETIATQAWTSLTLWTYAVLLSVMYPTVPLQLWKIYRKKEMKVKIGNNCCTSDGNNILLRVSFSSAGKATASLEREKESETEQKRP